MFYSAHIDVIDVKFKVLVPFLGLFNFFLLVS